MGSNFRGEVDVESMPHKGLRFRLRESHRLGRRVYDFMNTESPERHGAGGGRVGDMIAIRKALRAEERRIALYFSHCLLKLLSGPGVAGFCAICL